MPRGGAFTGKGFHERIISLPNLISAWSEFKKGKLKKQDVGHFALNAEEEIFALSHDLAQGDYRHSGYTHFVICDPKRRSVHKACVRDRLLHHAIFRVLEPIFDRGFICDSFSSRKGKGTHKAHERFRQFAWKLSRNNMRTVWTLKCDVRKFFDSVDHHVLLGLLAKKVDQVTHSLLREIVTSFETSPGKGIPIGNLTSQLFSNIYLNEFDHFVKRTLRVKHYIRYADDFVLLSISREELISVVPLLQAFLNEQLTLKIHPDKIIIRKWRQGVDFLGYVMFPFHQVMRTKTKKRMLRKLYRRSQRASRGLISSYSFTQSMQSYLGILTHCRAKSIEKKLRLIERSAKVG